MNRSVPYLILLVALIWLGSSWRNPKPKPDDFDVSTFSRLPVLEGGRVKPLDTVARNSLLILRGKQTVWLPDDAHRKPPTGVAKFLERIGLVLPSGTSVSASRWLADVLFNPAAADAYPVFAIANQEVLGMFGGTQVDKKYCSFADLEPNLEKIDEEGKTASDIDSKQRSPFQTAIYNLRNSLILYQRLKGSVHVEGTTNFAAEINAYANTVAASAAALKKDNTQPNKDQLALLRAAVARYDAQTQASYLITVPPRAGGKDSDWLTTGAALMHVASPQSLPVPLTALANLGDAFRAGDHAAFAQAADGYAGWLAVEHPEWVGETEHKLNINPSDPSFAAGCLYVGAFLLACCSWFTLPRHLRRAAFYLILAALALHSFEIISRMEWDGLLPVINLHASAIFVVVGGVAICLALERVFRDGIGAACAALVGLATLAIWFVLEHPEWFGKTAYELRFNQTEPFYHSMILYVGAFLLACGSWLVWPKGLRKTAFLLLLLALAVHSFGMFSRMYLQGRPPVTNLYSTAIFVGWGAVLIGIVLERFFRYGIGAACAGLIGFVTLIIAHHLGSNGDTLEMMQAVLDNNIWLATHVVIITAGYSAMFLAGVLAVFFILTDLMTSELNRVRLVRRSVAVLAPVAIAYAVSLVPYRYWPANLQVLYVNFEDAMVLLKLVTRLLMIAALIVVGATYGLVIVLDLVGLRRKQVPRERKDLARVFSGMVYGIICFATLFSFVGTVLGGIWADQSWGRFWGWDPKENGALLIVLWCGITLHARWGGFIRQRGLMAMAIGGNAITAFSWFGVNMLGVGLHSYGFMDKAFPWLVAFVIAQVVLIVISLQSTSDSVRLPAAAAPNA